MRLGVHRNVGEIRRLWSRPERRLQLLALAIGLAVVIAASVVWFAKRDVSDVDYWKTLGYPGVFFLNFLGSVGLVLPVPGLIALCGAAGLELNLIALGLLAGTGETLGEASGYAIGYGGQAVIERRSFYPRLRRWMERRGTLIIFLVSLVPNPFFDVVGIAAGALRFPLARFFSAVWVGKTTKGIIIAHTCVWITRWLPWVG